MKHTTLTSVLLMLLASCFTNAAYGVVVYSQDSYTCNYKGNYASALPACLQAADKQFLSSLVASTLKYTVAIDQSIYGTAGLSSGYYQIETMQIVNTGITPIASISAFTYSVKTTDVDCGGGPCSSITHEINSLVSSNVDANVGIAVQLFASDTNLVPFDSDWRMEIANTLWFISP